MSGHLSFEQMDEWIIGLRTPQVEGHLRACPACSEEVRRLSEPLAAFGGAMRSWGERAGARQPWTPVMGHKVAAGWGWRMAGAAAALGLLVAAPVYHREQVKRQAAVTAVQDDMLLRQVESGLARSVPAPMEPLAKLMSNDVSR